MGEEIALSSVSTGGESFKWEKDGVELAGYAGVGFNAFLNKPNSTADDAGSYVAVFTNAGGVTRSNPAVITITVRP